MGRNFLAGGAAGTAQKFLPLLGAVMCGLYVWFYNKKAKGSFAFCFFVIIHWASGKTVGVRCVIGRWFFKRFCLSGLRSRSIFSCWW